jgi:BirA family transcriptional regulator, biotin operon repressor / biotin---[acetyl-CoA-carboxylase] ligase
MRLCGENPKAMRARHIVGEKEMTGKTAATGHTPSNRDVMLDLLKRQQGEWISGQILAGRLSMTRAAIWKKVGILRDEGYRIDSLPHKGYRLMDIPDRLLVQEIREGLQTSVMGQPGIYRFERTDSTNRRAKEMAAGGAAEGTLVIAETQTQGRGRLDRPWFSPPGENICASLILRPSLPPPSASRMVLLAAVAVAETLIQTVGLPAAIKWPNDVLVKGKKIAGILVEMAVEMDAVDYMVIGLGLNVNTPVEHFPEEIRGSATSVLAETGKPFPRGLLLRRLLEQFDREYGTFRVSGFDPIIARWKAMTNMIGRRIVIRTIDGSHSGVVIDFDQDGFLILRKDRGGEMRFFSGDVTIM